MKHLRTTWLGHLIHRFVPYRRRVVMANIDQVFGDSITPNQKFQLAKAFYSHIATSVKETIQLRFLSEKMLCERVEVRGHQYLLDIAEQQNGVLVLTGHFGSWEFAPLGGILNFKQFKGHFHFIRRTLGNKTIERILFRRYFQAGLHVIPKQDALHQVRDALDKNHAVVFVLDQHASLHNRDGVAVEFFGKKAGTYRSLASISRHTGVPVVPAAGYRLPNGKHVLEFFEPIPWQEYDTTQESIYRNTLAYNQALERIILAHPEQWMWLHKRWKL
ncbi:MAG: lysophospholipid acyltransferase family protein [Legionellaceae bacterium]|nr:lysophospholipid acyltransferase family protein [Legionellaceae bacterium]